MRDEHPDFYDDEPEIDDREEPEEYEPSEQEVADAEDRYFR